MASSRRTNSARPLSRRVVRRRRRKSMSPASRSQAKFEGSCHCGAIGFVYYTAVEPAAWSVRACQCGFCRVHQAATTSDPGGEIAFNEHNPGALVRYRFGQKSADFLLCRLCGVYIGATMESRGDRFGIINANALISMPSDLPEP